MEFHFHFHEHVHGPPLTLAQLLTELRALAGVVGQVRDQGVHLMAISQGVQQRLTAIETALTATTTALTGPVTTSLQGIVADIQHLKDLAAGGGSTAEIEQALDGTLGNAQAVASAVEQLGATLADLDAQTTPTTGGGGTGPTPDPDAPPVEE